MPRPRQRTPELRTRVLEVALEILDREGPQALTARHVARQAKTSIGGVYELFGDKGGLVRAVFFEGFRKLGRHFTTLPETDDPRTDVETMMGAFRAFARRHPVLVDVMFSRPFTDFDPGTEEIMAGAAAREFIVHRLRRCIDTGLLHGDATDLAHIWLATVQGLARQETAGWLGRSRESIDRRWALAARLLFGE